MSTQSTVLERAYHLAKSGHFEKLSALRKGLGKEGFSQGEIEMCLHGRKLSSDLQKLIKASRSSAANSHPISLVD